MKGISGARGLGHALVWPTLLLAMACDGDSSVDGRDSAPARISLETVLSQSAQGPGALRAFDASDGLWIRFTSRGEVRFEQLVPVSPQGGNVRVPVELDVRRGGETMEMELELRRGGAALFDGSTSLPLRRGEVTPARIVLDAVVAGLVVTPRAATLDAYGDVIPLTATPVFATGDPIDGLPVEWNTRNGAVARVDNRGQVTAVADGSARIVARLGNRSDSALVNVYASVATVTVEPAQVDIPLGTVFRFRARLFDRRGNPIEGRPVTWRSSDPAVIQVAVDGTALARSVGRVDVEALTEELTGLADARATPISPGADVEQAGPLDPRTVEVIGNIRPNGLPTTVQLEWASDEDFTRGVGRSTTQLVAAGTGQVSVTIQNGGFLPGFRYWARILVENDVGPGVSETVIITMPIATPGGVTRPPTSVTGGGGTLEGDVDTGGGETTYSFQISPDEEFTTYREIPGGVLPPGATVQPVQVPVDGLAPDTRYCVRIVVTNDAGTTVGEPVCFTTPGTAIPSGLTVATNPASSITSTSARLNGSVRPGPVPAIVWFEWGTDPLLGATAATTPEQTVPAGGNSISVGADIVGLSPGTTYYVRLRARNPSTQVVATSRTFVTTGPSEPGVVRLPTPAFTEVSAITTTGARFAGTVDPNGSATMAWFEWSTDPAFGTSEASSPQSVGSGSTPVAVGLDVTGLLSGTTYYARMVASNDWGTVRTPPSAPFQTLGTAPTAVTQPASAVGPTTARLNGLVNPQGVAGEWWFEWSESPTLSTLLATPAQALAAGTTPVGVFHDLTTLGAAQPYYFRVVVSTPSTTVRGAIVGFETAAAPGGALPPVVTTFSPLLPGPGLMKLGGRVDTRGLAGVGWFEWGTDPTMSTFTRTPDQALPAITDSTAIYETLTGIPSGVTYYVRIVAATAGGLTRGTLVSVTIP
jgi:phosphodiesterase/alkaline phosphatase D-like protein